MLKGYEKYKSVNAFGMDKVPLQWNVKRTFSCLIENKKKNVEKEVTLLLQFKYGTIVPKKYKMLKKMIINMRNIRLFIKAILQLMD